MISHFHRRSGYGMISLFFSLVFNLFLVTPVLAATGGSITGAISDSNGAVLQKATIRLINLSQRTTYETISDSRGIYSFPNLSVGHYELTVAAPGFATQKRTGLTIDTDAALRVDVTLMISATVCTVSVSGNPGLQVDSISTNLGEVVSGEQMTALPLNGRGFTDLLALQSGVSPVSTSLPSSVIMAGVTGSIDPSGDGNPGNLSINGQRESANGFLVNGIDVQEHMNGGTSIIPNLDSIEQFRVLTNNFDPEYGNYNGGVITVVSKSGTNLFHGSAFEFFRNSKLDARGYFDPTRSAFDQNQFGGTIGGPLKRERIFFFADYQGTRTTQGISTGDISVPSDAQRTGDFSDAGTGTLTGCVSGPYLANLLSQELGHSVASGDPYTPQAGGCTGSRPAVFPSGIIPESAWSAPAKNLLHYIPAPNIGANQFSTSVFAQTVRDDKGSARFDANTRFGQSSVYYFVDDYDLDNPYPGSVAGASIPGFEALFLGRAQLFSIGHTSVFGSSTVNEFHAGYLRNANIIGKPKGGLGVSLASQGFSSGPDGIYVQAPQFEGVENITFPTFVLGVPITNETQINDTYFLSDGLSRVVGSHLLKVGAQLHIDQVNEHPNATFNGTFNIEGTETGNSYADFLLGVPSNYTQSSGQPFYLRNRYVGFYAQDSWRARSDLSINLGLRWDVIMPWAEKYNQIQTYVAGAQSTLYPGAPAGLLVAGDPGIPKTIAATSYKNLAPRIGFAYTPSFHQRLWNAIFGSNGESSIRASYGIFYTAFPGLTAGIMYSVPPFGFNYLSPGPPLLATPFITAATGVDNGQRFPFPFPSHNVSAANPDKSVNWSNFEPLAADPFFYYRNRVPYINDYMFSIQRRVRTNTLLMVNYAGNQGHHLLTLVSANPGDPALCLGLEGCGPFGEDSTYITRTGQTVQGTRVGQGADYGENTADKSVANSNYNALEASLRYQHNGSQMLLSYTYAKSIDQGSNLGEQLDPTDPRQSRAISAWDIRHNFVASYAIALPFDAIHHGPASLTKDWKISGTTRLASGLPVTLFDNSDRSLLGTLGNGANNYLLDTPQYSFGPLHINTNGRNGEPAFNKSLFSEEALGELGNAKRRIFHGPGIENFDLALEKGLRFRGSRALEFRLEGFNVFNHAQFYGPAAVNGQYEDPNFGKIESAAAPRLVQLAAKYSF